MQDLPPKQGFSPLNYKRNLPSRGPSGAVLLAAVSAVVIGGLFLHKKGERIMAELEREKLQGRLYLVPLLLAEADRETLRSERRVLSLRKLAVEKGLLAEGEENHIYHNKKNYIRSEYGI